MKKDYQKLFYEANKDLLDRYETTERGNIGNNVLIYTICFVFFTICIFFFLYISLFPQVGIDKESSIYLVILSFFCGAIASGTIGSLLITTKQVKKLRILQEQIEHQSKIFARSVLFEDIIRSLSKRFIINDNRSNTIMKIINENCWIHYDYSFDPEYVCDEQFDNVGWITSDTSSNRYFITAWEVAEGGFTFICDKMLPDGTIQSDIQY